MSNDTNNATPYTPRQFSERFAFPPELAHAVRAGELVDCSWGNDAMPHVELPELADSCDSPILWSDAINPDDSEFPDNAGRFVVFSAYELDGNSPPLYHGDDVNAALDALRAAGARALLSRQRAHATGYVGHPIAFEPCAECGSAAPVFCRADERTRRETVCGACLERGRCDLCGGQLLPSDNSGKRCAPCADALYAATGQAG